MEEENKLDFFASDFMNKLNNKSWNPLNAYNSGIDNYELKDKNSYKNTKKVKEMFTRNGVFDDKSFNNYYNTVKSNFDTIKDYTISLKEVKDNPQWGTFINTSWDTPSTAGSKVDQAFFGTPDNVALSTIYTRKRTKEEEKAVSLGSYQSWTTPMGTWSDETLDYREVAKNRIKIGDHIKQVSDEQLRDIMSLSDISGVKVGKTLDKDGNAQVDYSFGAPYSEIVTRDKNQQLPDYLTNLLTPEERTTYTSSKTTNERRGDDEMISWFDTWSLFKNNQLKQQKIASTALAIPKTIVNTLMDVGQIVTEVGKGITGVLYNEEAKNKDIYKTLNQYGNIMERNKFSKSREATNDFNTFENYLDIATSAIGQLGAGMAVKAGSHALSKTLLSQLGNSSKLAKTLNNLNKVGITGGTAEMIAGEKILKQNAELASKISDVASKSFFALYAAKDTRQSALDAGLSEREAGILSTAMASGMYMFQDYSNKLVNNLVSKDMPKVYSETVKQNLGDLANTLKIEKNLGVQQKEIEKNLFKKGWNMFTDTADKVTSKIDELKLSDSKWAKFGQATADAIGEGREEAIEYLIEEGIKQGYNTGDYLKGLYDGTSSDKMNKGRFKSVVDYNDGLKGYLTDVTTGLAESFAGGLIGGGSFSLLKDAVSKKKTDKEKEALEPKAMSDIELILNGNSDDYVEHIKKMSREGLLGSKELSTIWKTEVDEKGEKTGGRYYRMDEIYQKDDKGNVSKKAGAPEFPSDFIVKSQNQAVEDTLLQQHDFIKRLIADAGVDYKSEKGKILLESELFKSTLKARTEGYVQEFTSYQKELNKSINDLVLITDKIQKEGVKKDNETADIVKNRLKPLEETREKILKSIDDITSGKNHSRYFLEGLLSMKNPYTDTIQSFIGNDEENKRNFIESIEKVSGTYIQDFEEKSQKLSENLQKLIDSKPKLDEIENKIKALEIDKIGDTKTITVKESDKNKLVKLIEDIRFKPVENQELENKFSFYDTNNEEDYSYLVKSSLFKNLLTKYSSSLRNFKVNFNKDILTFKNNKDEEQTVDLTKLDDNNATEIFRQLLKDEKLSDEMQKDIELIKKDNNISTLRNSLMNLTTIPQQDEDIYDTENKKIVKNQSYKSKISPVQLFSKLFSEKNRQFLQASVSESLQTLKNKIQEAKSQNTIFTDLEQINELENDILITKALQDSILYFSGKLNSFNEKLQQILNDTDKTRLAELTKKIEKGEKITLQELIEKQKLENKARFYEINYGLFNNDNEKDITRKLSDFFVSNISSIESIIRKEDGEDYSKLSELEKLERQKYYQYLSKTLLINGYNDTVENIDNILKTEKNEVKKKIYQDLKNILDKLIKEKDDKKITSLSSLFYNGLNSIYSTDNALFNEILNQINKEGKYIANITKESLISYLDDYKPFISSNYELIVSLLELSTIKKEIENNSANLLESQKAAEKAELQKRVGLLKSFIENKTKTTLTGIENSTNIRKTLYDLEIKLFKLFKDSKNEILDTLQDNDKLYVKAVLDLNPEEYYKLYKKFIQENPKRYLLLGQELAGRIAITNLIVNGDATVLGTQGSGKTTIITNFVNSSGLIEKDTKVIILTPDMEVSKKLSGSLNVDKENLILLKGTNTKDLNDKLEQNKNKKMFVIIDEAGLYRNDSILEIKEKLKNNNSKILLLGDNNQSKIADSYLENVESLKNKTNYLDVSFRFNYLSYVESLDSFSFSKNKLSISTNYNDKYEENGKTIGFTGMQFEKSSENIGDNLIKKLSQNSSIESTKVVITYTDEQTELKIKSAVENIEPKIKIEIINLKNLDASELSKIQGKERDKVFMLITKPLTSMVSSDNLKMILGRGLDGVYVEYSSNSIVAESKFEINPKPRKSSFKPEDIQKLNETLLKELEFVEQEKSETEQTSKQENKESESKSPEPKESEKKEESSKQETKPTEQKKEEISTLPTPAEKNDKAEEVAIKPEKTINLSEILSQNTEIVVIETNSNTRAIDFSVNEDKESDYIIAYTGFTGFDTTDDLYDIYKREKNENISELDFKKELNKYWHGDKKVKKTKLKREYEPKDRIILFGTNENDKDFPLLIISPENFEKMTGGKDFTKTDKEEINIGKENLFDFLKRKIKEQRVDKASVTIRNTVVDRVESKEEVKAQIESGKKSVELYKKSLESYGTYVYPRTITFTNREIIQKLLPNLTREVEEGVVSSSGHHYVDADITGIIGKPIIVTTLRQFESDEEANEYIEKTLRELNEEKIDSSPHNHGLGFIIAYENTEKKYNKPIYKVIAESNLDKKDINYQYIFDKELNIAALDSMFLKNHLVTLYNEFINGNPIELFDINGKKETYNKQNTKKEEIISKLQYHIYHISSSEDNLDLKYSYLDNNDKIKTATTPFKMSSLNLYRGGEVNLFYNKKENIKDSTYKFVESTIDNVKIFNLQFLSYFFTDDLGVPKGKEKEIVDLEKELKDSGIVLDKKNGRIVLTKKDASKEINIDWKQFGIMTSIEHDGETYWYKHFNLAKYYLDVVERYIIYDKNFKSLENGFNNVKTLKEKFNFLSESKLGNELLEIAGKAVEYITNDVGYYKDSGGRVFTNSVYSTLSDDPKHNNIKISPGEIKDWNRYYIINDKVISYPLWIKRNSLQDIVFGEVTKEVEIKPDIAENKTKRKTVVDFKKEPEIVNPETEFESQIDENYKFDIEERKKISLKGIEEGQKIGSEEATYYGINWNPLNLNNIVENITTVYGKTKEDLINKIEKLYDEESKNEKNNLSVIDLTEQQETVENVPVINTKPDKKESEIVDENIQPTTTEQEIDTPVENVDESLQNLPDEITDSNITTTPEKPQEQIEFETFVDSLSEENLKSLFELYTKNIKPLLEPVKTYLNLDKLNAISFRKKMKEEVILDSKKMKDILNIAIKVEKPDITDLEEIITKINIPQNIINYLSNACEN